MLYICTKQVQINNYWMDEFKDKFEVKSITMNFEWDLINITNDDILIIDLDDFETVEKVLQYIDNVSTKINTIALVEVPKLAYGTLMIKKGCKSYLGKKTSKIIVQQVLKTVQEGNVWLYPELMDYIIKNISVDTKNNIEKKDLSQILSPTELKVANLVALGNSNKEIAQQLDVQLVTVKKHIGHIFAKLNLKDRVSLAIFITKNR